MMVGLYMSLGLCLISFLGSLFAGATSATSASSPLTNLGLITGFVVLLVAVTVIGFEVVCLIWLHRNQRELRLGILARCGRVESTADICYC